jgi:hypothetical protein
MTGTIVSCLHELPFEARFKEVERASALLEEARTFLARADELSASN